ncbi:MAG: MBL fold metallo-hydrolase [Candidatus Poseidoniaceae archaeon]
MTLDEHHKKIKSSGKVLLLLALMLWFYRNNLQSVNFFIVLILLIRGSINLLCRTSVFTKKEVDVSVPSFKRKAKIFSTMVLFFVIIILLSATAFLNLSPQVGGDPGSYDSPNYYDGKFNNLNETSVSTGSFFGTLLDYMVGDDDRDPNVVLPTKKFQNMSLNESDVSITWFGHSTILIQSHNTTILMDPILGDGELDPLIFGPSPFAYQHTYGIEDLPQVDYVFISHDHYDHLDMGTIQSLTGAEFFVPLGVKSHLTTWDIPSENVIEFDWYDEYNVTSEFFIALTPSQHFSGRGLSGDNTLWGSWVLDFNGHKIFFSGDSGYSEEYVEIGDKYGPFDIAIIEAGQYNEAWSSIHMFPEQSVQASIDLNASTILPIHNTKYVLALHKWDAPLERVTAAGELLNQTVSTPYIGESFVLGGENPDYRWWRDVEIPSPPWLKESVFVGFLIPLALISSLMMINLQHLVSKNPLSKEEE